jgi:hypothetical protein
MANIIIFIFLYAFFITMEIIKQKGLNFIFNLRNKYVLFLCFSEICLILYHIYPSEIGIDNPALKFGKLFLSMISVFFMTLYMLFRGIFILFSFSKEGLNHPTITWLKKIKANKVYALIFILVIVLIGHISQIYNLYLFWSTIK